MNVPKCWPKLNPIYNQCHYRLMETIIGKLTTVNPTVNAMPYH